jgi:hypothetical protein
VVLTLRKSSGTERRQHPRIRVQNQLRVAPIRDDGTVDWDAAYEAVSKNLSPEGLAMLQSRLATTRRILIGMQAEGQSFYIPAEVRHCRSVSGDVVELGCRFQTAPGKAAVSGVEQAVEEVLHGPQEQPSVLDERRGHRRVVYTERIQIFTAPNSEPLIGFARDLSKGGIAFITTKPLPAQITVLLPPQGPGRPLRLRAQVVRCDTVTEGFFDVGAHFLALAEPGTHAREA